MPIACKTGLVRYLPHAIALLLAALVASIPAIVRAGDEPQPPSPDLAFALFKYFQDLRGYANAQEAYEALASAYWNSIAEKRRQRISKRAKGETILIEDYLLMQPPVYAGPPRPVNPLVPKEKIVPAPPRAIPVVADFLAAAEQQFGLIPRKPTNEIAFKRAYAKVAAAAGLTKDQVVRIYGFEATGNGTYDVQAGLEYNKPGEHAVSTALGYNQLLSTNSVELMAEQGSQFLKTLSDSAVQLPDSQQKMLQTKIAIVQQMVDFSRSVPDAWDQHQILAESPKGLGIHAMNLDLDVGPLLQTQKLLNSVLFARAKGIAVTLSATELEMMNLTGDGNGLDMITLPLAWRSQVPTANFFQRHGYDENPVAQRNNVVSSLIAATDAQMDEEVQKQGARDLAEAFADGQ